VDSIPIEKTLDYPAFNQINGAGTLGLQALDYTANAT
jgi:hypothetical protein